MKFASQVYTQVSGSVGGLTYSHNKGGMYSRGRAIPTNPSTDVQITARADFSAASTRWNLLDESERQLWRDYAATQVHIDKLGATILWSGQQEFIASNSLLNALGQTLVDVPPLVLTKPPFELISCVCDDAQSIGLLTSTLPAAAGARIFLGVSRPVSPGKNYFKGPFCRTASGVDVSAGGTAFSSTCPFVVAEDQAIWLRGVYVLPDGRYSGAVIRSTIVLAA